ncbi:MAG: DPP IV N-terminal domain-containing protein, partial [Ilumatobacter fluminis]
MTNTDQPSENPHTDIARRFLHERSDVHDPQVSPDGDRVAHVVTTCNLDENTTSARIWLDGTPVSAGPHDSQPRWSPDGRWLAFTSRRGEKKGDATLHVLPVAGPGEVRTVCTLPEGITDITWSPDGSKIGFISRTRDERYDAKDVSWQSPRKVERYFSRLNGDDWVFDRPSHVYVVNADGTGTPKNLTPGEFQHDGIAWTADSTAIITSAQRHDDWDTQLASDLYRVDLDETITLLTDHSGNHAAPAVSPDGSMIAFLGNDNPTLYPQNTKVGVMAIDGSERRFVSEGLDRTFFALNCPHAPLWIDDTTLLAAAEDRGATHVYRLTTSGDTPEPMTDGALNVTGFDQRSGTLATARSTVSRTSELVVTRDGRTEQTTHVGMSGRDWEHFLVSCTDGSDEIDAWIMR